MKFLFSLKVNGYLFVCLFIFQLIKIVKYTTDDARSRFLLSIFAHIWKFPKQGITLE